jgi:trehalose 6-phosphate synthase
VDFKEDPHFHPNGSGESEQLRQERYQIQRQLGVQADYLGIGVDRLDYTKGIPERFRGIERFLERYPSYIGRFTFAQVGAPSRTHIGRYQVLIREVEGEADRINRRFETKHWKPIVFLKRHHNHQEIEPFYRAADLCLVTSLHDGMNLVAKEYVASRTDEGGALILSLFAGASRELQDALIVNPYDTEQLAEAIHYALDMDSRQRRERMRRMRRVVKQHNIYRWAANLIGAVSEIRVEQPKESNASQHRIHTAAL